MTCEPILKKIKPFLDDLLEEKDYQDVSSHLRQCGRCHQYASSISSLSYQLDALGNVQVPPDMLSTVLYSLKKVVPVKTETATPESVVPAPTLRSNGLYWAIVASVFFVSIGAVTGIFVWQKKPIQSSAVTAPAPSLPQTSAIAKPEVAVSPQTHWHYHLFASSREEFSIILSEMGLVTYYDAPDMIVLNVPKQSIEQFTKRLATLSGVLQEFGDRNLEAVAGDSIQISIYFE